MYVVMIDCIYIVSLSRNPAVGSMSNVYVFKQGSLMGICTLSLR
jgi:hypothetical protein